MQAVESFTPAMTAGHGHPAIYIPNSGEQWQLVASQIALAD